MVWLTGNLKLEVTQYSKDLFGPRGLAYPGNDDDDSDSDGGEDSEATPSHRQGRGIFGDPYRQTRSMWKKSILKTKKTRVLPLAVHTCKGACVQSLDPAYIGLTMRTFAVGQKNHNCPSLV